jgi:hypothetical protein
MLMWTSPDKPWIFLQWIIERCKLLVVEKCGLDDDVKDVRVNSTTVNYVVVDLTR